MAGWDERIAQLEAEFPGWHIWRSNAGRWWATRTGTVLRREDLGTGRVMTVGRRRRRAHSATSSPSRRPSIARSRTDRPTPAGTRTNDHHPGRGRTGHL